jgi:hypothetical protein
VQGRKLTKEDLMPSAWGDRFWSKVQKTSDCWLWSAARDPKGYGRFGVGKKTFFAHRVAWWLSTGKLPSSAEFVCHKCDNPRCVRFSHLFLGDNDANVADRDAKARVCRGERHADAELSVAQVLRLRAAYRRGENVSALARKLGLSVTGAYQAAAGKSWAWLKDDGA